MGSSGNYITYIDYHDSILSATANQRLQNRIPTGLYYGADLTIVNNTTVSVSAFDVELYDGTYNLRCTTSGSNNVTVSNTNIYIVLRWAYTGTANDVPSLLGVSSVQQYDVLLGQCVYSGSTLNGFNLANRNDAPNFIKFGLVEPTNPASLAIKVRACTISNSTKTFFIPEQITSSMTAPSSVGQSVINVIAVNPSTGAITIINGTAATTGSQVAPSYSNNLPLAQVTIANGQSTITASNIVDCRPFINATNTNAVQNPVNQVAHGFSIGNIVRQSSGTWVLAQGDSLVDSFAIGMVSSIIDVNDFLLTSSGYVTGLSGLTAGSVYYLSPTSAGSITTSQPSGVGQIVFPIFIADTTTSGYFLGSYPSPRLGTYTSASFNTPYQAATDIYVIGVGGVFAGQNGSVQALIGTSSPNTQIDVDYAEGLGNTQVSVRVSFFVPKGYFWQVNVSGGSGTILNYIPYGIV